MEMVKWDIKAERTSCIILMDIGSIGYKIVLGRLINESINNPLVVIFSDYRFVRNIID